MPFHALLKSQIKKSMVDEHKLDVRRLLALVSDAYEEADRDRRRTDRSIDLMVAEIDEANAALETLITQQRNELSSIRLTLDAAMENTIQGILVIDGHGRITAHNPRVLDLLDVPHALLARRPYFMELLAYQSARGEFAAVPDALARWITSGGIANSPPVYERVRPNGTVLEVRTVLLASGGAVRTFTDVTADRNRVQAPQQAESLHRNLFENAASGLFRASLNGKIVNANLALAQIYGWSDVDAFMEMANSSSRWHAVNKLSRSHFRRQLFQNGRIIDFECEMEQPGTGLRKWISTTAWMVRDGAGKPVYYEGSVTDISQRKATEHEMAYRATHDDLTGLPNRAYLMHWLSSGHPSTSGQRLIAVHCVDLDRFKEVNDDFGHAYGDRLLKLAALRMNRIMRGGDFIIRLGGDEFAVVQLTASDEAEVKALADHLVQVLAEDYQLQDKTVTIGASVGSACCATEAFDGEHLLRCADIALYRAKTSGRNAARLFDRELEVEHERRRMIETSLKPALVNGEFSVAFQPIHSLKTNRTTDFEALLRWRHPVHGMISPAEFIPIAEHTDLINPIGEWVLKQACAALAASDAAIGVSVNLSPAQLRQRSFVGVVAGALAQNGLAPGRLTLEITESVLLSNNATTRSQLKELRDLGVRIALDDFGIGYSSLGYLKDYQFDKIKIDRSFIAGWSQSKVNGAVIHAIIELGHELGFEVIAEGVEQQDEVLKLMALGCDCVQGYYYGMPRPAEEWLAFQPRARDSRLLMAS